MNPQSKPLGGPDAGSERHGHAERHAHGTTRLHAEWITLALVVAFILLLLVVPIWVADRNERLRDQVDDLVDPAQRRVAEVQYHLAREMGALRGYLLTGEPDYLARQAEWMARTSASVDDLAALAPALGGTVVAAFVELHTEVDRWHRLTGTDDESETASLRDAALEQIRYQDALGAAASLTEALAETSRTFNRDLRDLERRTLLYTVILALLAVASAIALMWLALRVRRLAEEAARERGQAQEALKETRLTIGARDRLIRGVSHDVKNPLGAADGYAELLQLGLRGPMEPPQQETVRSIRRSIQAALHTIEDLLSLSEAENPNLTLRLEPVRVSWLVHEVVDAHRGVAEAAERKLTVETRGSEPIVRTDGRRVEQVLGNLLSNAIKYSAPGGAIRVSVTERGAGREAGGTSGVEIRVADTGPGIPPEDLGRIFDEFQRLNKSGPGHGLGLAISRTVARRLGGDLTVESQPGDGTVFILSLPLDAGE